ncbi:hypothetical protein PR202_gb28863 [Eleusine coracana subsp. coracana]|uniref:Uncharacterized protein n=1 Tax=Eleusine coracana subsp. coracana TaxID=191504 RepID=A0AAV5FYE6_ELECO|nr:hypothetical protein PR202_gb28863 [Eleusine coracana subsp. coracana]
MRAHLPRRGGSSSADDDTAFVLPNLLRALGKYDWREPWYLGARSESAAQNAWHGFAMAYGGSGIAVSWPLARRLARALDSCVVRYPHLYGSDARIRACVRRARRRAHPRAGVPPVSLHHLDNVYPLYPGMDRTRAMQHFFRAANADPARILQQTVCYDRVPDHSQYRLLGAIRFRPSEGSAVTLYGLPLTT